ncbi:putative RNA methyltransferase [Amedibacillus sp. YH-ame6]
MLVCPKCKGLLQKNGSSYICEDHHCFDIAKRGYVNLLLGNHKTSGDDKEMIIARTRFLSHGYYQPLCDRLIEIVKELHPTSLVDAGCGEGFYTNQIMKVLQDCEVYGFDLSKHGVDEACKAHTSAVYGVANVFHLPLADACADVVLSVFAPFDEEECARVLKEHGVFIKVGPGPQHLMDMKNVLYEEVYENEKSERLQSMFTFEEEYYVDYETCIDGHDDIWALFQMTPYFWKSPKEGSDRLRELQQLSTRVQFHIEVYRK